MASMISKRTGTQRGAQSRRHRGRRGFLGLVARNCSQRECADTGSVGEKAMILPLSRSVADGSSDLARYQANLMPTLASKSQAEPMRFPTGGRLRGCLVHRSGQDVAPWTRACRHSSWLAGCKISACTAESVPASKGLDGRALTFIHHLHLHP
jgi:hypothetical protein